jgi:tetratricopeptide (TPR) repeat protein
MKKMTIFKGHSPEPEKTAGAAVGAPMRKRGISRPREYGDIMNKHLLNKRRFILATALLCALACFPGIAPAAEKPGDEKDLFKKAVAYFYERKFEMAELMFQVVLKTDPENQLAYSYLGDIFLQKKRLDEALGLYRKALDLNPKSGEDHFRIGQVYYYKKDGRTAISYFKRAYDLNPQIKFSYYHIGLCHLMLLRDKKNTIANWEAYLNIAPEDPQYEKIRRAIELLKDPNFVIPPVGSEISIEEALHLGGMVLREADRSAEDKKAGHEGKKTKNTLEDIYREDGL